MRFKDTLHFNGPAYSAKLESLIASKNFDEIREREVKKNRQIWGYSTKIGMGAILAMPTMGLSSISSVVGMRQLWIACSKLDAITAIIQKYGVTPYECQLRDAVIPIVIHVLTAGIGFGVSAATDGVTPAPNHGIEAAASSALQNSDMFAQGLAHGMQGQVDQVQAVLFEPGDAASNVAQAKVENAIPIGYGDDNAFMNGAVLGAQMMPAAEKFVVQQAIMSSLETLRDDDARRRIHHHATLQGQEVAPRHYPT